MDHTNTDRVKTEEGLMIVENFKSLFNLFQDDINPNALEEIEGKFDKMLEKLYYQRNREEEPYVEITDSRFKDSIEEHQIDEYDLQEGIENNYPEVLEDENINKKVKFEVNGFLMSLVLKRRGDILEIVKGTIKKSLVFIILCLPLLTLAFNFPKSLGPVQEASYEVICYHSVHFFMQYPKFTLSDKIIQKNLNNAVQKMVNGMYEDNVNYMLNATKEFSPPFSKSVSYKLNFKITFWGRRYVSILFSDNAFLCGAHADGNDHTLNFDMKRGKVLRLSDLFSNGTDYISELSEIVKKSALSETGGNFPFFKSIKPDQDFVFLSDDTLLLIFQEYEYTPYSLGRPKIYVDISRLKGFKLKLEGLIIYLGI